MYSVQTIKIIKGDEPKYKYLENDLKVYMDCTYLDNKMRQIDCNLQMKDFPGPYYIKET